MERTKDNGYVLTHPGRPLPTPLLWRQVLSATLRLRGWIVDQRYVVADDVAGLV
jgi:hypothetical protein